jgi:hypothetical protein
VLNSCIGVSDYNEQHSLCQPLLPSPESPFGLTRSTQRQPTPLHRGIPNHHLPSTDTSLIASACNFPRNDTGSCAGSRYSKWYLSTHSRACDNVPKLQDVGMGERTNLEFGTPREHVERQSQRKSHAPGLQCAGVRCMSGCAHNTLATLLDASPNHTDARKSCAQAGVPSRNTQVRTPWVESGAPKLRLLAVVK